MTKTKILLSSNNNSYVRAELGNKDLRPLQTSITSEFKDPEFIQTFLGYGDDHGFYKA